MIQHLWTVICSRSLVDVETQNLSLINVLEEISVPAALVEGKASVQLPMPFEVIALWSRQRPQQAARGKGQLTLLDPDGKSLEQQSFDIDLGEFPRSRTRIRVPGLQVSKAGTYLFKLEVQQEGLRQWQLVSSLPLVVHIEPKG